MRTQRGFTLVELAISLMIIGLLIGAYRFSTIGAYDSPIDTGATAENRTYWLHLIKAGLISGINASYSGTPNQPGVDFPALPYNSAFQIAAWDPVPAGGLWKRGHYLIAANQIGVTIWDNLADAYPIGIAAQIDRKIDDGAVGTGEVLVSSYCGNAVALNAYPPDNPDAKCSQLIYLNH